MSGCVCGGHPAPDRALSEPIEYSEHLQYQKGVKHDEGKLPWSRFPWEQAAEVLKVMVKGAEKYSWDNWQLVEKERYVSAAFRHLIATASGERLDQEDRLSHLAHAAADALFALWHEMQERA